MDGNEDVGDEGRFSYWGDPVGSRVVAVTTAGGPGLVDGAGCFAASRVHFSSWCRAGLVLPTIVMGEWAEIQA